MSFFSDSSCCPSGKNSTISASGGNSFWFSTKKFHKSICRRATGKSVVTINTGIFSFAKYYHELEHSLDVEDDICVITASDGKTISGSDVEKIMEHVREQISTIRKITGLPFHYEGITKYEDMYCINWGS